MTITTHQAKQKGSRYALQVTLTTELAVVLLLFTFLLTATKSTRVFLELIEWMDAANIMMFVLGTGLFSFLLGKKAGVGIIVQRKNHWKTGCWLGVQTVVLATTLSTLFALTGHLLGNDTPTDSLLAFIAKPFVWIIPLSVIPVVIAGVWYGYQMEKQIKRSEGLLLTPR
jgi:uncharacterized membrane protein